MREEVLYVIFLDLTKEYDALDRSRILEILKGYGVGGRVRKMLREYWKGRRWWQWREVTTGRALREGGE